MSRCAVDEGCLPRKRPVLRLLDEAEAGQGVEQFAHVAAAGAVEVAIRPAPGRSSTGHCPVPI